MKTKIFYKVRRKDGKYYNPSKPGNRVDPAFDDKGKPYASFKHAQRAQEFCASAVNNHWVPAVPKTPVETDIIKFSFEIKEIGVVTEKMLKCLHKHKKASSDTIWCEDCGKAW